MHPVVGPVCPANEQRTLNSTRQTTTTDINVTTDRGREREEKKERERGREREIESGEEGETVRCLFYCVLIFAIYAKARHCTRFLSLSLSLSLYCCVECLLIHSPYCFLLLSGFITAAVKGFVL